MNQRKASKKLNITVLLIVALLLIVCSIIGVGIGAKYKESEEVDFTVQFTADLVDTLTLTETKAVVSADGTYTLDESQNPVTTNSYMVLPGVDIPKDPKITIEGKSDVPAYLFVELLDSGSDTTISYNMTSDWKNLGIQGRKVYVYTNGGADALEIDASTFSEGNAEIYLLENNKVFVSETYAGATFDLTFSAFMVQAIDGKTAADVFAEADF